MNVYTYILITDSAERKTLDIQFLSSTHLSKLPHTHFMVYL